MASDDESIENLSKIFQEGLDLFNNIDKTDEPTNSSEVQVSFICLLFIFGLRSHQLLT